MSEQQDNAAKLAARQAARQAARKKYRRKRRNRAIVNTLMGFVVFCAILGVVSSVSIVAMVMNKSDVVLDISDLKSNEVSMVYDDQGNEIARLGKEQRINFPYSQIPQVVIDAFVSVEDSRYFEHIGFDLPRFAKAFLENIRTLSFAQGGSTITMQVIKNSYFAVDTIAEKSIGRKIQEIYYSIKVTNVVSKEKILELYINKVNYGAAARGIQVAADYYFGKDPSEVTLVEAALLAGVVNGPNDYNPYFHPIASQTRTEDVLYLMHLHGYLTDEEYELACKVNVIDLVVGRKGKTYEDGKTIPNQAYIDTVIDELEDVYEIDPYSTPVRVYTAMNQQVQAYCDKISNGEVIKFKDQYINYATAIVQNQTGLIVGLCGGRNYDRARKFNYATQSRLQPGSTAKAVLTYPLGFEYCGLSTSYYYMDEPIQWTGTSVTIRNDTGTYYGQVSIQRAFCSSYNIPAVKTMKMVIQTVGNARIRKYITGMGFSKSTADYFNEQFAIGGANFLASPLQMAGACSAILSGGKYTQPHTITRIEFINSTEDPITPAFTHNQVLSAGAAWLTSFLMKVNVDNSNMTESDVKAQTRVTVFKRGYDVYGKTGTTSVPDAIAKKYKTASSSAKDTWLLAGTNDFSISSWLGYDYENHSSKNDVLTNNDRKKHLDSVAVKGILDTLEKAYGKPKNKNPMPSTVTMIDHIRGLYPYTSLPLYADAKYETHGLILNNYAQVEQYESPASIEALDSLMVYSDDKQNVTIVFSPYPDTSKMTTASNKISITNGSKTISGTRVYHSTWIDGVVQYHVVIRDQLGNVLADLTPNTNNFVWSPEKKFTETTTLTVSVNYRYSKTPLQSNTLTRAVTVKGTHNPIPDPIPEPIPEP